MDVSSLTDDNFLRALLALVVGLSSMLLLGFMIDDLIK